jgi:fibronectin-binding autotransporter adhesin
MLLLPSRDFIRSLARCLVLVSAAAIAQSGRGASATWNTSPTNGNWVTTAGENNWSTGAGTYPGAIGTTNNQDTATFLTSSITTIDINSANLNVKNITFGVAGSAPSSFTIGTTTGNALRLTSGGQIQLTANITGTGITETVNAPLILEAATATTAGSYSFQNSSATASNTLVINGAISGGATSSNTTTLTLSGANTGANTVTGAISNGAAGAVRLTKESFGTWSLSGGDANTYTGRTSVTAGLLVLNKTAGVNAISSTGATGTTSQTADVVISSQGTLRLDASDQIINSARIGLSGGTLALNGVSEGSTSTVGVGALSMAASSIIDLASTSLLHFAASGGQTWIGTLSVWNWSGSLTGGGAEQLLFGTSDSSTSLTQAQLNSISFYSGSGTGFLGTGGFSGAGIGEVVPVPEPSTWAAGLLTIAALGYAHRRRFAKLLPARRS